MKRLLQLAILLFFTMHCFSQSEYVLEVDGKTYDVNMDGVTKIKINGKEVPLKFSRRDTLTLKEGYYKFNYTKEFKLSRVTVDEGITQSMLMTAGGSGVIVQSYEGIDPTMLTSLMLNEVTKESVSYGYTLKREDYDLKLDSGQTLSVLKAVLEYKGEKEVYEVTAHGKKDEGILIMTMNMNTGIGGGEKLIEMMWKTLQIF